jgi:hypothetical protein
MLPALRSDRQQRQYPGHSDYLPIRTANGAIFSTGESGDACRVTSPLPVLFPSCDPPLATDLHPYSVSKTPSNSAAESTSK